MLKNKAMIEEIALITDPALAEDLEAVLIQANPALRIVRMKTRERLEAAFSKRRDATRLISFGADIIVPESVLGNLGGGAYNFHPGPPTHPGLFPSCFFIYDGGTRFGSTVHEMAAKVDSGPINAVHWFDPPENVDRVTLNALSFQSLFGLFRDLAPHLAVDPAPLARTDEHWSGRLTTKKDFEALCLLPEGVDAAEFQRRYRAVGEGPDHALEISLHGHRFRLDNQYTDPTVLVGGRQRL